MLDLDLFQVIAQNSQFRYETLSFIVDKIIYKRIIKNPPKMKLHFLIELSHFIWTLLKKTEVV